MGVTGRAVVDDRRRDALVYPVATVVLALTVSSFIYGFITRDFQPCVFTVPMMAAVIAYALGVGVIRKNGGS